jgi:hypothetical protein
MDWILDVLQVASEARVQKGDYRQLIMVHRCCFVFPCQSFMTLVELLGRQPLILVGMVRLDGRHK